MLFNILESDNWTLNKDLDVCLDRADDALELTETATLHECARKCHGLAEVFAYGTNDFGRQGCQDGLCKCQCVKGTNNDDQNCHGDKENYWFFRYKPEANFDKEGNISDMILRGS